MSILNYLNFNLLNYLQFTKKRKLNISSETDMASLSGNVLL